MALGVQVSGIHRSQHCAALPTISEVFWSPRSSGSALPSAPAPVTLCAASVSVTVPLSTRVSDSHSVRPLHLSHSARWRQASPCSSLCPNSIPFYGWILFHCIYAPCFVYHSFLDGHGFFPLLGCDSLAWTFASEYLFQLFKWLH